MGVGPRQLATGYTGTAAANDLSALYWNPAGLAQGSARHEVGFQYTVLPLADAQQQWLGFTTQTRNGGTVGISLLREGISNTLNSLDLNRGGSFDYDNLKAYTVNDYALTLAYGQRTRWYGGRISLGGALKVLHRRKADFVSGWGLGLDMGLRINWHRATLGIALADVPLSFVAWTFNSRAFEDQFQDLGLSVPLNRVELTAPGLRVGGQYRIFAADRPFQLTVQAELQALFDKRKLALSTGHFSLEPRLGAVFSYREWVYVATGATFDSPETGVGRFTFGLGGGYKIFQLEYAAALVPNVAGKPAIGHFAMLRIYLGTRIQSQ